MPHEPSCVIEDITDQPEAVSVGPPSPGPGADDWASASSGDAEPEPSDPPGAMDPPQAAAEATVAAGLAALLVEEGGRRQGGGPEAGVSAAPGEGEAGAAGARGEGEREQQEQQQDWQEERQPGEQKQGGQEQDGQQQPDQAAPPQGEAQGKQPSEQQQQQQQEEQQQQEQQQEQQQQQQQEEEEGAAAAAAEEAAPWAPTAAEVSALEAAEALKREGNDLYGRERYEEALGKYQEALDAAPGPAPQRAVYFANMAACCLKLQQPRLAAEHCSCALRVDGGYIKALMRRATAFEEVDDLDHALADAKRVLELDPASTWAASTARRLEPLVAERHEKLKAEMLGKLKDLGNSLLGRFGLSLDNFKAEQDPATGGYSIKFSQQ